jgi:hypothetical protein
MLNNSFHILNRRHFIKSGIAASVIVSSGYAYSSNTKSDKLRLAFLLLSAGVHRFFLAFAIFHTFIMLDLIGTLQKILS